MDYRLGPRFIPEPTQGFKPPSINFIFTPVSKHDDSFIWAAQVDNVFFSFFRACLATQKKSIDPYQTPREKTDTCASMNKCVNNIM